MNKFLKIFLNLIGFQPPLASKRHCKSAVPFFVPYLFFLQALSRTYPATSRTIVPVRIMYIAGSETSVPKKYRLQSIASLSGVMTSSGSPCFDISVNTPPIAWLRTRAVPYVPGRKEMTFCNPSLKEDMGIYAPQIKPYPELTIVPTAEI